MNEIASLVAFRFDRIPDEFKKSERTYFWETL